MTKYTKFLCILLSLILLLFTFTNPFATFVNAQTLKFGFISENNVIIRKDASTDSDKLANVSQIYLKVIGSKKDIGSEINPETNKEYIWYNVTDITSAETIIGFVREDLITVKDYTIDTNFKDTLSEFPETYQDYLTVLHIAYPNWVFKADKVPNSFEEAVASQDYLFYKLIQAPNLANTKQYSLLSMRRGCYDWSKKEFVQTDSGGWYGASREVIAYYMDPRNFLNANDIFLFLQQSFTEDSETLKSIEAIIKGTFLDSKIDDENDENFGKSYASVILLAAKKSSVNPYVLASTILQEQGSKGTVLTNGAAYSETTVYNFFNFGASGSNETQVLNNAKRYAFDKGWTTPSQAIFGGANEYNAGYIDIGQDTYFYKNFNVLNPDRLWHQYAQNVADSLNSSRHLKTVYSDASNLKLTFRIPVYELIPDSVSQMPKKNGSLNNYYFSNIICDGLTPSFNRYNFNYSLSIDEDTTITLELPDGATAVNKDSFSLKKGANTVELIVKSQTGYQNVYTITVDAQKACVLSVITSDNNINTDTGQDSSKSETENSEESKTENSSIIEESSDEVTSEDKSKIEDLEENENESESVEIEEPTVVVGDTNGDGKVTLIDLANVRLHLLKLSTLKDEDLIGADTNTDGKISITDLANIRLHLLKIITLE